MSGISNYGNTVMRPGDKDQRYRLTVFLVADLRPKYWDFLCVYCGRKVVELAGEAVMVSDMDEVDSYHKQLPPIVIKCQGNFCKRYYEFVSLS